MFTTLRLWQPGGDRKKLTQTDRTLRCDLESVDPVTRGEPQSPLRWTCKSTTRGVTPNVGSGVSVGTDPDTAEFAVATIRQWWRQMGMHTYPYAHTLLIIADAGGSNGWRTQLWKAELQRLANVLDLSIAVCHLPPRP